MKTCIIVGAGGRGKDCYAPYIKKKGILKIVGVAEPDEQKRNQFKKNYNIADEMCFSDYRDLFSKGKLADSVIICTQDKMHLEPTRLAVECGYHILLEKPIATTYEELLELEDIVRDYDKIFTTGFVLRYTPFIQKIKEIIKNGEIGDIITMQLNENEGFWHHAHSYVRGPWNNVAKSSPLIVAKSCHDFDLMFYLIDAECKKVSSYGSNQFFKKENAPEGVPLRCTDGCRYSETCVYNAVNLYTTGQARYFVHKFECPDTDEAIIDALKTNPYGRCVYRCDNDVCDHQVASVEFENGVTAVFTVSAFSRDNTRTIKIMGSKGEIGGCMEAGVLVLKRFSDMSEETIHITHDGTKHCGGDGGLMDHFAKLLNEDEKHHDKWLLKAHKAVFSAEKSRLLGRSIDLFN